MQRFQGTGRRGDDKHVGRDYWQTLALSALITFHCSDTAGCHWRNKAGASPLLKRRLKPEPLTTARQPLSLLDKEQVKVVCHHERRNRLREVRAASFPGHVISSAGS